MSDVRINGLAELQQALQQLPAKMERNVLRGALRAGGNVLRDEAKSLVPVDTGALRDTIRVSTRARGGQVTARVLAGSRKKGEAFYAHLVEFGTAPHKIAGPVTIGGNVVSNIEHPGTRAQPFLRPALDNPTPALEQVREYIRNRLSTKHGIDVPGPGSDLDE